MCFGKVFINAAKHACNYHERYAARQYLLSSVSVTYTGGAPSSIQPHLSLLAEAAASPCAAHDKQCPSMHPVTPVMVQHPHIIWNEILTAALSRVGRFFTYVTAAVMLS